MEKTDIARTLEIALQFLWDGNTGSEDKTQHVCNCILRAKKRGLISFSQWHAAEQMIMKRLGNHYTVIGWLETQDGFRDVQKWATHSQLQAYRRAWVLSMIKEFKNA